MEEDEEEYRLLDGSGKNVGVWGRELDDVAELPPPESLDCGRRNPVLTASELMGPVLNDGDGARFPVVAVGRKAVGAGGLEIRRFSLKRFASLSFCGEGESSMMRTHPDESPTLLLVFFWLSLLSSRESTLFLWDSQLVFAVDEFDAAEEAELIPVGVVTPETGVGLPVILGILRRGTRVCIFCSKLRTLARISDTIWTPLFLAIDPVDEVLMVDGLRTTGRMSPRGLGADGLGRVFDRITLEEFLKAVIGLDLSWKPVRRKKFEGRADRDKDAFGVMLISGSVFSQEGDMSAKSRSGGG